MQKELLTVWDASSSKMTFLIMLVAILIFMPLVNLGVSGFKRTRPKTLEDEFLNAY